MTDDFDDIPLEGGDADQALAAEYALGLLDRDDERAFEQRLALEPALRAAYAIWAEDFTTDLRDTPEVQPAKSVRDDLQERMFQSKQSAGMWGMAWSRIAGIVVILFVVVFALNYLRSEPNGPTLLAQLTSQTSDTLVYAGVNERTAELRYDIRIGTPPPGRAFELWLIVPDRDPISLGMLKTGGEHGFKVPQVYAGLLRGGQLAITDEPPEGAPGGVASGDLWAIGEINPI